MSEVTARAAAFRAVGFAVAGVVAGPFLIQAVYLAQGFTWRMTGWDWTMGPISSLLFPIAVAVAVAVVAHRKSRRLWLRVFVWAMAVSATVFHLWFSFFVLARISIGHY
ncbi:hypothetical protein ONR57_20305 [Hoyosella sp. YIM 151337]|uniref:hypothetical protein n=1 Tax=Hoyosella sp. YIM 151337 TaxID=2992742 RepID=UPI00223608D5|nr:hypothetical protein [Hoyosella sp. YIM 151337]MCW4355652.1 hypothetical protein [Hoyosella sp. YIM 151337]